MMTWQQIGLLRLEQCIAMGYHLLLVEWQLRQQLESWVVKVLAVVLSEDYFGWELMELFLLGASTLRTWGLLGFALGILYNVNGTGVSLEVGHFVDVVMGFVIRV